MKSQVFNFIYKSSNVQGAPTIMLHLRNYTFSLKSILVTSPNHLSLWGFRKRGLQLHANDAV